VRAGYRTLGRSAICVERGMSPAKPAQRRRQRASRQRWCSQWVCWRVILRNDGGRRSATCWDQRTSNHHVAKSAETSL